MIVISVSYKQTCILQAKWNATFQNYLKILFQVRLGIF